MKNGEIMCSSAVVTCVVRHQCTVALMSNRAFAIGKRPVLNYTFSTW